jgi:hypothetical protein
LTPLPLHKRIEEPLFRQQLAIYLNLGGNFIHQKEHFLCLAGDMAFA